MKKVVKLISLHLENFKGAKDTLVNFGEVTRISGANGTGKSTIFDAFTWVLFGKNAEDRTDSGKGGFQLKTVDGSGESLHNLEHRVTAVLEVNGQRFEFSKLLKEQWVKKRGTAEIVFSGHATQYFIDGLEVKASRYDEQVNGIINAQLFKLITNPTYFPALDWKKQRDILTTIAGSVTLEMVAAGNADFEAILRELSGKSLQEFREAKAYDKKTAKQELDDIPVRIATIEDATPAPHEGNPAELEAQKAAAQAQLPELDAQLTDIAEATRQRYAKARDLEQQIGELQLQRERIINGARQQEQARCFEANARRREMEAEIKRLSAEIAGNMDRATREQKDAVSRRSAIEQQVAQLEERVKDLRAQFYRKKGETYTSKENEAFVCPVFGHLCGDAAAIRTREDQAQRAKEVWYQKQREAIVAIQEEGKQLNEEIARKQQEIAQLQEEADSAYWKGVNAGRETQQRINELKAQLEGQKEETPKAIIGTDIKEWRELSNKIDHLTMDLNSFRSEAENPDGNGQTEESRKAQIFERKAAINAEIAAISKTLGEIEATERVRAKNAAQIAQLRARERELAQRIAEIEKREMLADSLQHAQMDEIERRVNGMFKMVRFRMYEKQINGGETDTCLAMINGVPFADANKAGKINGGLDIINTLCRFHGITAPIFIDNAESVNDFIPTESQIIKLEVTREPQLTITEE